MNKAELINAMAASSGMSKTDTQRALDAFIEVVTQAMKDGDKVMLVGFGAFVVSERMERTGVNPATGKKMTIPAKKVVRFKPGSELSLD